MRQHRESLGFDFGHVHLALLSKSLVISVKVKSFEVRNSKYSKEELFYPHMKYS